MPVLCKPGVVFSEDIFILNFPLQIDEASNINKLPNVILECSGQQDHLLMMLTVHFPVIEKGERNDNRERKGGSRGISESRRNTI